MQVLLEERCALSLLIATDLEVLASLETRKKGTDVSDSNIASISTRSSNEGRPITNQMHLLTLMGT